MHSITINKNKIKMTDGTKINTYDNEIQYYQAEIT
jgi:hypothetical protein